MITFKNRYAEFDNLDDSYNENVLRNCYHKEYLKNFTRFKPLNKEGNLRYSRKQNFNDIRMNNFNSYQRQNAYTPFPQLPLINSNNNINYNNYISNNEQNIVPSRSSPNMPSLMSYNNNNMNHIGTPYQRYNNNNNISNDSGFISNNYDVNMSNDNLNISNDSQYNDYNQNMLSNSNSNQLSLRQSLDNELDELEKERKLLLEQEKINQLDFELRYLRQKRNSDLQRRLAEQQQNLQYINRIKETELENSLYNNQLLNNNSSSNTLRRINNNYRINNYGNNNKSYNNNIFLEEALKSSIMNDKFYMNELIEEINKMKISQQEANMEFQKKMKDLAKQNESLKLANQKMIEKIKDMKNVLSEKKDNDYNNNDYDDYNYDYLIKERNNRNKQKRLFNNNYNNDNKSNSFNYNKTNRFNKNYRSFDLNKNEDNNYNNFYLGKKDKDIEEFNLLNKNLVNTSKKVVVTPLLFNEKKNNYTNNRYLHTPYKLNSNEINSDEYNNNKNYTIGNDYSDTRKENLYSLIRTNNNRLEKIKEIEEKS